MTKIPNPNYNTSIFPTWCPGCGDFGLWGSLKQALANLKIEPYQLTAVFGIGCHGNMASFLKCYGVHSLHGRSIPTAAGIKLANHKLPVLVIGGDGDLLGEGLNHFMAGARANYDITVILHNNQLYSLTTGQASPTSLLGTKTKTTLDGVIDEPINPAQLAISGKAGLVARGFAGDMPSLTKIMMEAMQHPGFSLVEVLQPCVTFNKLNTYEWFRQRIKPADRTVTDKFEGLKVAEWNDETIYTGILYKNNRPAFHQQLSQLKEKTLAETTGKKREISDLLKIFK